MSERRPLSATEAAAQLGIQRASLYAYVSRGVLQRTVAIDGKTSLFDADEVAALSRRRRGRPPLGIVDVVLSTSLTRIADDGVWYRGRPLVDIAGSWTFEQTAHWLWTGTAPSPTEPVPTWPPPSVLPGHRRAPATLAPTEALLHVLALADRSHLAPNDPMAIGRQLITDFADAASLSPSLARRRVVAGSSIATRLGVRFGRPELTQTIELILVLLADHELASSTLAARVAASTHADVHAAVAAGLATLSGRLHGGVTRFAHALLQEAFSDGAAASVHRMLDSGERLPGFGHSVYRTIDPRAVLLFEHLATNMHADDTLVLVDQIRRAAGERMSAAPNIDLALAAFLRVARLPPHAAEWLFAVARTAGWVAHIIEEYGERPLRFRPRSVYVRPQD